LELETKILFQLILTTDMHSRKHGSKITTYIY